ncbi:MAG: hypothetical protein HKP38_07285 [Croceitalea sp.]|nr:hypothetical protein [Croceitalea sp.]MBT8238681.1 hypothetical protein [Croceitalea sp.]NNL09009.1 hypothetical protein [Croceitalea sp.]
MENNLVAGTWRISKFIDSGQDETNDFNGFTFTFEESGVLSATNGTITYEGTWNVGFDDSSDSDDFELTIVFNLTNDFEDLTDDWDFIQQSSSRMELIDRSDDGEPDDLLTFEKN